MSAFEIGEHIGTFIAGFLIAFVFFVVHWKGGNFLRVAVKRYKLKSNKYIKSNRNRRFR